MKNLFTLAEIQLIRERNIGTRTKYSLLDILNYAIKIRKWLNKHSK